MIVIANVVLLLVDFIFDIYIIILILRLLMQKLGASYHNLVAQFVIRTTNLFVLPLRCIIFGFKGFELAVIFLIIVFSFIQSFLLVSLRFRLVPHFIGLLVISTGALGNKFMNLYFYMIIMRIIMSWVVSSQQNPITEIIFLITEPVMRPIRRLIPMIIGFDFTPFVLLILFPLVSFLIFDPLTNVGMRLALN
ncbi:YGGT family protein [Coxiella endosymbiont of Amblyomma nuttalli]|nr:YGGT family protein [Coxiella endosymbiont of Amblyomma nuttalli]